MGKIVKKSMRIHHLQHVPFEGPGTMESYFLERGHQLGSTHFYRGNPIPSVAEFDWLRVKPAGIKALLSTVVSSVCNSTSKPL